MTTVVSIDGTRVDPAHASISVFDRGLLYGDGCFEVLRTWGGVAVDLDAHLDRLCETIGFLAIKSLSREAIAAAVHDAIRAAGGGEHRIRIVVTRGPGSLLTPLAELGPGHTIVILEGLPPPRAVSFTLAVVDWPLPMRSGRGHKTLAYLDHVIARELARAAGADEGVRLDAAGAVVEGATSNLFVVTGGAIATPPIEGGVLPGIVRARVLAIVAGLGIPVAVRRVPLEELRGADEIFATSSLRGVVPVTAIDGVALPTGPIATRIATAYVTQMMAIR